LSLYYSDGSAPAPVPAPVAAPVTVRSTATGMYNITVLEEIVTTGLYKISVLEEIVSISICELNNSVYHQTNCSNTKTMKQ